MEAYIYMIWIYIYWYWFCFITKCTAVRESGTSLKLAFQLKDILKIPEYRSNTIPEDPRTLQQYYLSIIQRGASLSMRKIWSPICVWCSSSLRKILQHKRHFEASHWDPSKLTHFNTGILTRLARAIFIKIPVLKSVALLGLKWLV